MVSAADCTFGSERTNRRLSGAVGPVRVPPRSSVPDTAAAGAATLAGASGAGAAAGSVCSKTIEGAAEREAALSGVRADSLFEMVTVVNTWKRDLGKPSVESSSAPQIKGKGVFGICSDIAYIVSSRLNS